MVPLTEWNNLAFTTPFPPPLESNLTATQQFITARAQTKATTCSLIVLFHLFTYLSYTFECISPHISSPCSLRNKTSQSWTSSMSNATSTKENKQLPVYSSMVATSQPNSSLKKSPAKNLPTMLHLWSYQLGNYVDQICYEISAPPMHRVRQ